MSGVVNVHDVDTAIYLIAYIDINNTDLGIFQHHRWRGLFGTGCLGYIENHVCFLIFIIQTAQYLARRC
jgi:hypothetical protein